MKTIYTAVFILALSIVLSVTMLYPVYGEEEHMQKATIPAAQEFSVARMVVAEAVQDKEPVNVSETFPATTESVYCFIEAKDIASAAPVSFIWSYEGKEVHRFTLPLEKGTKWRTFASKKLYGQKGTWKVELQDSAGNTVKTIAFKVE
jgi:hypothetical protein